jgi:dienelactone hydrolase
VSWPIINGFFEELYKAAPTRVVLVAGYCWSGRYALLLTHRERWMMSDGAFREGGFVHAAFCAHPSLLAIPKEITAISRPASFALGDCDEVVPTKSVERIRAGLAEKSKAMIETEVVVYEGAQHGFAIRADLAKPMEKIQFEEVTQQAVRWFKKFL